MTPVSIELVRQTEWVKRWNARLRDIEDKQRQVDRAIRRRQRERRA